MVKWQQATAPLDIGILAAIGFCLDIHVYCLLVSDTTTILWVLHILGDTHCSAGICIVSASSSCVGIFLSYEIISTIQFVGISAFHTRISDPLIGGTYMTVRYQDFLQFPQVF